MRFRFSYRKKAKLFANSGDPDQTPQRGVWSESALFANYPFRGLPTTMDEEVAG